MRRAPC